MKNIEVKVLNPEAVQTAKQMLVACARLTQRGHTIKSMSDFDELMNKPFSDTLYESMVNLPHTTIQRFATINMVIVGASRRFLAQITRAQVGVTFMSASLQYSNYEHDANFVVPYNIMKMGVENAYLEVCKKSMEEYSNCMKIGIDNDEAGYQAPQGLRNVLVISANPLAWKQMISTRVCSRNTKETQYVMLKCWEALYKLDPILFSPKTTGPKCCREGKFSCKKPLTNLTPTEIIKRLFPLLVEDNKNEN